MKLPPIILLAGVGGSKIDAVNKKNSKSVRAWVNFEQLTKSVSGYVAQYLWGQVKDDGVFHSFCEDYMDIKVIEGLEGCDKLIDLSIFGYNVLENFKRSIYFKAVVEFLESVGYEYGRNLLCYTYDWRQAPYLAEIQEGLKKSIDQLFAQNDQKVHLIGHSLGGLVIDFFIRDNQDYHAKIAQFIAIATPFDGCGALALESALLGYQLKLPIPKCTAKVLQCNGIGTLTLGQHPDSRSHLVPQVFVKLLKKQEGQSEATASDAASEALSLAAIQSQNRHRIQLHQEVYQKDECPDVLFIIAQKILNGNEEITNKDYDDLVILQKGCKPGAITIQEKLNIHLIRKDAVCIEKKISKGAKVKDEYEQMAYHVWYGKTFATKIQEDTQYLQQLAKQEQQLSQFEKIQVSSYKALLEQDIPQQYVSADYYQLVDKAHSSNIVDRTIYRPNYQKLKDCEAHMKKPLEQGSIRFRSICGTGINTAFYMIFDKPVQNEADLLTQQPRFAHVPGDGTVSLIGSFGDHYNGERVILDKMTHFGACQDQRVFNLIKQWVVEEFQ